MVHLQGEHLNVPLTLPVNDLFACMTTMVTTCLLQHLNT